MPKADHSGGFRGYEHGWKPIDVIGFDQRASTFDQYIAQVESYIIKSHDLGAIGIKMYALPWGEPSRNDAKAYFDSLKNGSIKRAVEYADNPLRDYVWDFSIDICQKLGMVIAVHAGFGGDHRYLNPSSLMPVARRHPDVMFDLYHLGYPWVNEAIMLAFANKNVYINLCGVQMISQAMVIDAMRTLVDIIPFDRVIAYGADNFAVEKSYGHLLISKENVSAAFSDVVTQGRLTIENAVDLATKWYYDNPKELYMLS